MTGAILMNLSYAVAVNSGIESKARAMGMVYPDEIHVQLDSVN